MGEVPLYSPPEGCSPAIKVEGFTLVGNDRAPGREGLGSRV